MLLTLKTIRRKLRGDLLPLEYDIKSPKHLSRQVLFETLSLFKNNDQLTTFIGKIISKQDIWVSSNNFLFSIGSIEQFIAVYLYDNLRLRCIPPSQQDAITSYIQSQQFNQSQLLYLLNHLKNNDIRDLILTSDCFHKKDLILLCNQELNVKRFDYHLITLLYQYLNPQRQWASTQTPILDMHYFAFRAGHVLGITQKIKVKAENNTYYYNTNGNFDEVSMDVLVKKIDGYRQSKPSRTFDLIYQAMKRCHNQLELSSNTYQKDAADIFFHQYLNNELTYISTGWPGHTVGVALYGRYLACCNRGQHGDQTFGCKIFEILDTTKVNQKYFELLTNSPKNYSEFMIGMLGLVDMSRPILRFRCKGQKRGNCSFVSPKSIIKALIVLMQIEPYASRDELYSAAIREKPRFTYKNFTKYIRDREVDELVKNMFYAQDKILIQFYASLVKAIISEHHGRNHYTSKHQQEARRAYELYYRCPSHVKDILKNDVKFMHSIKLLKINRATLIEYHFSKPAKFLNFYSQYGHHTALVKKGYVKKIDNKEAPRIYYSMPRLRKFIERSH